jgi:hypothetical protein
LLIFPEFPQTETLKIKGGIMINPKSVALVFFAVAFGFASVNVQAAPGDSITFTSAFVDKASGNTYHFQIDAQESPSTPQYLTPEPGVGRVDFLLYGPRLFLITVGKGEGWLPGTPPTYPPNPLAAITAGPADHQAVDIDAHVVEISAHAFVHSDAPYIVFIGPVTVDVRVESRRGYNIRVVISSPKGQTKLEGKFTP